MTPHEIITDNVSSKKQNKERHVLPVETKIMNSESNITFTFVDRKALNLITSRFRHNHIFQIDLQCINNTFRG